MSFKVVVAGKGIRVLDSNDNVLLIDGIVLSGGHEAILEAAARGVSPWGEVDVVPAAKNSRSAGRD